MFLQGKKIALRSVLTSDANLLYKWENDESNWKVSGTEKPYSEKEITDFIANQKDLYLDKQLRLMICTSGISEKKKEVGCIDLFEFDERNRKAGIGILISKHHRNKGYASEALSLLIKYGFETLFLQKIFCSISEDNTASMKLFQKQKFQITGIEKNIYNLQLINN